MKENNKNYIFYIIGAVVIIGMLLFVYFSGRSNGVNSEKNKVIDTEVKTLVVNAKITQKQIDSIQSLQPKLQKDKEDFKQQETIVKKEIVKVYLEKPKDTVCNDLYNKANIKIGLLNNQISLKDNIEDRSNKIINNQSSVINKQESLIKNKDEQIELIKNKKTTTKRFGLGLNIGYGISVGKDVVEARPYVGVGLSYNFANF